MNEWDGFDDALTDAAGALPPSDRTVAEITPWRHAVNRILAGLVLTTFTLNFFYLQYILPAVGALNLYLGFRALRGNGRALRLCWRLSLLRLALLVIGDLLDGTPLSGGALAFALGIAGSCITFALFFFFRRALRAAYAGLGEKPRRDPMLGAMIWYLVMTALALLAPMLSIFYFVPMAVAFALICLSLRKTAAGLEALGYAVVPGPARFSDGALQVVFYPALAAAVFLTAVAGNHQRLTPLGPEPTGGTAEIRENLEGLGFPAELLGRLPDGEAEKLAGAVWCSVSPDSRGTSPDTGVEFDTVYVRLNTDTFRIYEFFRVDDWGLRPLLQNGLSLEPDNGCYLRVEDAACRVWWNDETAAELPLMPTSYDPSVPGIHFTYRDPDRVYTALFSYPLLSHDRGGYAAYTAQLKPEITYISSILRYGNQPLDRLLPYQALTPPYTATAFGGTPGDGHAQSYSTCQLPESK